MKRENPWLKTAYFPDRRFTKEEFFKYFYPHPPLAIKKKNVGFPSEVLDFLDLKKSELKNIPKVEIPSDIDDLFRE